MTRMKMKTIPFHTMKGRKSSNYSQFNPSSASKSSPPPSLMSLSSSLCRIWSSKQRKFLFIMKPTSKVEFYRDENQNMNSSSKSSGGYGDDSLNSFFHKRHLDATRKSFPEVRSKDGRLIDPNQDDFLMLVCREMDRNLLRTIKDTPLPPHYINYKDANGWVS